MTFAICFEVRLLTAHSSLFTNSKLQNYKISPFLCTFQEQVLFNKL